MDLRESTSWLMRAPDIAHWMRLADSYMQAYNRVPDRFILPKEHAVLQPVIEAYALDQDAFVQYLLALRNSSEGPAYDELHDLYRTVSMRVMQTGRRARLRNATVMLVPIIEETIGRQLRYEDEMAVSRFIEQSWGAMRLTTLASARNQRADKRLPTEERAAVLTEFWNEIDAALARGQVSLNGDQAEQMDQLTSMFTPKK